MPRSRPPRKVGGRTERNAAGARPTPARRRRGNAPALAGGLGGDQVEGRQAVRELLIGRRRAVEAVFIAADREHSPIVAEIIDLAEERGVLRIVSPYEITSMARSDVPQGVLARAEPLRSVSLDELVEPSDGRPPFIVIFDGVTDPHNLGAVLRSALSAGVTGAVLARHRSVHVTPVVAKAAAGAIEYLPIALVPGIPAALLDLRNAGVWTVGMAVDGTSNIDELSVASEPLALVLGAEGSGLSSLTHNRCDLLARIDLSGPLGSLNVAAAAAVACFAVARQRAATPAPARRREQR